MDLASVATVVQGIKGAVEVVRTVFKAQKQIREGKGAVDALILYVPPPPSPTDTNS